MRPLMRLTSSGRKRKPEKGPTAISRRSLTTKGLGLAEDIENFSHEEPECVSPNFLGVVGKSSIGPFHHYTYRMKRFVCDGSYVPGAARDPWKPQNRTVTGPVKIITSTTRYVSHVIGIELPINIINEFGSWTKDDDDGKIEHSKMNVMLY